MAQGKGYQVVHRVVTALGRRPMGRGVRRARRGRRTATMVGLTGRRARRDRGATSNSSASGRSGSPNGCRRSRRTSRRRRPARTSAEAVVTNGRAAVEADAAVFYALEPDGTLRLLASDGYEPEDVLEEYRTMSLDGRRTIPSRRGPARRDTSCSRIGTRSRSGTLQAAGGSACAIAAPSPVPSVREARSSVRCSSRLARDHAFGRTRIVAARGDRVAVRGGPRVGRRCSRPSGPAGGSLEQLLTVTDVTLSVFDFDELGRASDGPDHRRPGRRRDDAAVAHARSSVPGGDPRPGRPAPHPDRSGPVRQDRGDRGADARRGSRDVGRRPGIGRGSRR